MDAVARLRRFNRSVAQHLGVLDNEFLGRKRSIGASRMLFEIGPDGTDIRSLRERLGLDSGYSSRLIGALEREGLVRSRPAPTDGRVRVLRLTAAGRGELSVLNRVSDSKAGEVLAALTESQQTEFLQALDIVERYYSFHAIGIGVEDPRSTAAKICISSYYAELSQRFESGFDPAKSISADPNELEPPRGCLLVARFRDRPIGCGALKFHGDVAEIKRMWIAADHRGMGLGKRILNKLEEIAKNERVTVLRLETNESLKEAQSLYRNSGYIEVPAFNEEPYAHHWFEKNIGGSA